MMLQKIDTGTWRCKCEDCMNPNPNPLVWIREKDGNVHLPPQHSLRGLVSLLPPGVVLAQEVDAPADPFVPDWSNAPEWALWHAVDEDGNRAWHALAPYCVEPDSDVGVWHSYGRNTSAAELGPFDLTGLDWRNSLRSRPDGA